MSYCCTVPSCMLSLIWLSGSCHRWSPPLDHDTHPSFPLPPPPLCFLPIGGILTDNPLEISHDSWWRYTLGVLGCLEEKQLTSLGVYRNLGAKERGEGESQ